MACYTPTYTLIARPPDGCTPGTRPKASQRHASAPTLFSGDHAATTRLRPSQSPLLTSRWAHASADDATAAKSHLKACLQQTLHRHGAVSIEDAPSRGLSTHRQSLGRAQPSRAVLSCACGPPRRPTPITRKPYPTFVGTARRDTSASKGTRISSAASLLVTGRTQ